MAVPEAPVSGSVNGVQAEGPTTIGGGGGAGIGVPEPLIKTEPLNVPFIWTVSDTPRVVKVSAPDTCTVCCAAAEQAARRTSIAEIFMGSPSKRMLSICLHKLLHQPASVYTHQAYA
jgi:hypothetical protein